MVIFLPEVFGVAGLVGMIGGWWVSGMDGGAREARPYGWGTIAPLQGQDFFGDRFYLFSGCTLWSRL